MVLTAHSFQAGVWCSTVFEACQKYIIIIGSGVVYSPFLIALIDGQRMYKTSCNKY
jgi:hypothetical protein